MLTLTDPPPAGTSRGAVSSVYGKAPSIDEVQPDRENEIEQHDAGGNEPRVAISDGVIRALVLN